MSNNVLSEPKRILVVMFDTPVPVDYGGVYDAFARLKLLRQMGYEIELLCTAREADRLHHLTDQQPQLCPGLFTIIHILPPRGFIRSALSLLPFSASLRLSELPSWLKIKISNSTYAFVLVEHLKMVPLAQCLRPLVRGDFYLRMHNDEAEFYMNLAREAGKFTKKCFFCFEAIKYFFFQRKVLRSELFSRVFFISLRDLKRLGPKCWGRATHLPIAFALEGVLLPKPLSKDTDFLYVANLESDDNIHALRLALKFLAANALKDVRVVVCGRCRDPSRQQIVLEILGDWQNSSAEFNVSGDRLSEQFNAAKFFLNFSANSGGVKTKLSDALSYDLGVVTNEAGVGGSGLDEFCIHSADHAAVKTLQELLISPAAYTEYLRLRRNKLSEFAIGVRKAYSENFADASH